MWWAYVLDDSIWMQHQNPIISSFLNPCESSFRAVLGSSKTEAICTAPLIFYVKTESVILAGITAFSNYIFLKKQCFIETSIVITSLLLPYTGTAHQDRTDRCQGNHKRF